MVQINTIEGYENIKDYYWISNSDEDKIINKNTGKILKTSIDSYGYKSIRLMAKDGKQKVCRIHVIKVKAFIYTPNPLNYDIIRHLNDCKTDNRLANLVWGTQADNVRDCIRNGNYNYKAAVKGLTKGGAKGRAIIAKKYSKPVRCIETGEIFPSAYKAECKLGFPRGSISHCCRGERKKAGNLHWEFINQENED